MPYRSQQIEARTFGDPFLNVENRITCWQARMYRCIHIRLQFCLAYEVFINEVRLSIGVAYGKRGAGVGIGVIWLFWEDMGMILLWRKPTGRRVRFKRARNTSRSVPLARTTLRLLLKPPSVTGIETRRLLT